MAVFVVTGGFGVLGKATAQAAVACGWEAVLIDVTPSVPQDIAKLPGFHCYSAVNLLDEAGTSSLFSKIDEQHGGIAVLANIAGGFTWVETQDAPADIWRKMYDINVLTTISASRAALPSLRRNRGSIINIGANAALRADAGMGPYTAAKSAVHKFTEALAEEERKNGVRVNAVLPSIIDTPTNRRDMPDADTSRWVAPEDLAQVILFLGSLNAQAISGVLLPVTK